jgi:peptidoglycan-associated lipoprotein
MRSVTNTAILLVTLGGVACGRQPRPAAPIATDAPAAPTAPARPSVTDYAESRAREAEEARRREEAARLRSTLEQMVFFDYDRSNLREDGRRALDAKLPILRENPGVRLRIEGHADERGSVEYNLALSLRRAQAVRAYLENFGINPSRLEVVGFGEEQALETGRNEAAYARNRRAEFNIIAGLASAHQ